MTNPQTAPEKPYSFGKIRHYHNGQLVLYPEQGSAMTKTAGISDRAWKVAGMGAGAVQQALDAEWDAALLAARNAAMASRSHDEVPANIRKLLRGEYP